MIRRSVIEHRDGRSSRLKYSSRPDAELFGQGRPRVAGRLRDAAVFADFLVVHAAAEQGQGRVVGLAIAAAARGRAAATAALGVDSLGLEQELDGLGLRGDRRVAGLGLGQDRRSPRPSPPNLSQKADLVGELAFGVGQFTNLLAELVDPVVEPLLGPGQLAGLPLVIVGQRGAGMACWATRVSSRRLTSPSRI